MIDIFLIAIAILGFILIDLNYILAGLYCIVMVDLVVVGLTFRKIKRYQNAKHN